MQNMYNSKLSLKSLFRTITLFTLCLFFNQSVTLAQCGNVGSPTCADSDVISFPFTDNMIEGINNGGNIPGCPQGAFHNTTWYRITPTTPTISITITAANCSVVGNNQGFQAGMYPTCDANQTPIGDVQCDCAQEGQPVVIAGDVVPGTDYFIFIDGCAGSVCEITMNITEGDVEDPPAPPMLGTPDMPTTTDPIPTCDGATMTFTIPEVEGADQYIWNVPGDATVTWDCNEATVTWGPSGGNVNVAVINTTTGAFNIGPPLTVPIQDLSQTWDAEYCTPTLGGGQAGAQFFGDGTFYTAGVYQVTVPGPICDTPYTLTVVENLITIDGFITEAVSCNQGNDGPINDGEALIMIGGNGSGPYQVNWDNGITGMSNNQLFAGPTGVTVTDLTTGCIVEDIVNIDEPPFLSAVINIDIAPSCGNAMDGELIVFTSLGNNPVGNTSGFTYNWSDGGMGDFRPGIGEGIYDVTVVDANGCEFVSAPIQVIANGGNVTATESNQSPETCTGANNGSVTLTGVGAGTFTFTWPDGMVAATRTDLPAGNYDVVIENGTGCSGTQTVVIGAGSSFTVDPPVVDDVNCFNESNGSVTVNVTGGTAPISFDLGAGTVSGNVISNLPTGNYMLTVTDGSSCSNEIAVSVGTPTEFLPTIANTPVSCGGNGDGTATVTPSGGVTPYTYMWGDGETTQSLSNLSGGTYTATVTDGNMCSQILSTVIPDGGGLGIVPVSQQLVVSCPGATDGSTTINVTGASGTVTYAWTGTGSTSDTADNLAAGTYSVIATDAAGCASDPFEVIITEPNPILVTEVGTTQTSCFAGMDGTAEVSVSGGTGTNYTFDWDNGETTNPAVALEPGPHTVIVTDENMCPQTFAVMIGEPMAITAVPDTEDPKCFEDNNGSITVNAMGGSGAYSFDIGAPGGPQTSNVFSFLGAGTYSITVTNTDGSCEEIIPVTLIEQTEVEATVTPTAVSCSGLGDGTITVTPSGGVTPYTYLWTDGETTPTITGKNGGGYFVTVTDANLCSIVLPTSIAEPNPIVVTLDDQTGAACDGSGGATASVNVSGGDGAYTYTWSAGTPTGDGSEITDLGAGVVTVTVQDGASCSSAAFDITIAAPMPVTLMEDEVTAESCFGLVDGGVTVMTNGGNGGFMFSIDGNVTQQVSNEFTNLVPGAYTVMVTDNNGCTDLVNITVPAASQIIGNVDPVSELTVCNNESTGSVTINASGGNGVLMFVLDNNGTPQTSNVFDNLDGGNHIVTVIDENGCESQDIIVDVTELAEIDLDVNLASSELTICDDATNGTVSIDASGGNNSFMYTLGTDTQASNEFSGLTAGNYTVLVTDGNNCTNSVDFTVTELAAITIDLDANNSDLVVCSGESDGTVNLNASGGDNNLTFSIPGFADNMNGVFDNLPANTYTVTVMDGNMCSNTFDFTVDPAPAITAQIDAAASNLALCNGGTEGSVMIDASGGDGTFMFTLDGIGATQSSPVFENLPAGNYTGTVEDGNGCRAPIGFTVTEADPITGTIASSDLRVCNGSTDGTITITPSGGDGTFSFRIDGDVNTQTSNVFDDLAPGSHTIEIIDGNGCTASTPVDFLVEEADPISNDIDAVVSDLLVCDGATNGSITIEASGGTGTLMYSIDGNLTQQPSNVFSGLGEGTYTIIVSDVDGCTAPMPVDVTIDAADPVAGIVNPISALNICDGTNGSITINVSGGTGPGTFTCVLNPGNVVQTTDVFDNLPAGDYTIDIEDGNGCTATQIAVTIESAPPVIASIDPNSDLVNCFGETDGSITIDAVGGNGLLLFDIGNGPQASNTFENLAPGNYSATVTDQNNCPSVPIDFTVTETAVLDAQLTLASSDLTVCAGVADGSVAIEVTGGDGNYMYALDGNPAQAGNAFTSLAEGNHIVDVIDGNGCEQSVPFMVAAAPAVTYTTDITNVGCFGAAEGQITVNVMAGEGPFTYAWSSGQVTETAQLLTGGPETVTITDANMCEVTETFMITEPTDALSIDNANAMIQPATCGDTNGSVSVSVSGGTPPYSFAWSDGTTTTPDLTAVGPGSYTFTVTDFNMCEMISESFSVSEPGALEVLPTAQPVACNGDNSGSISLAVTGGTAPYTFDWSDNSALNTGDRNDLFEGIFTVVVSDADGCILPELNITISEPEALTTTLTPTQADCGTSNGSVSLLVEGGTGVGTYTYAWLGGSTDANLTNVPAGVYDVTVTDQNMCTIVSQTSEVTNPGTPTLTISGDDVNCFGASTGSITLDIMGGSGGNTITWSDSSLVGLTNPTNLPAGDYFVTVTDMSMCAATTMITIGEPAAPIAITEISIDEATCGNNNGSVTVDVTGGTGNYTYAWSSGTGTSTVSGLASGNVTLTITDQNMCTEIVSYNVSEPNALQVNDTQTTIVNADCNGASSGSIDVSVMGGTTPYTYLWANGFGSDEDLSNLSAGDYSLLITDASGCEFTFPVTITEPDLLTAISTAVMANCGQSNGGINITVSGGTTPYDFAWSDGITTSEDLNNVPAGSNTVTITDFNQCEFILTDEVVNPNPPMITIASTDAACNGTATGTATINVTGGSGDYTYDWSDDDFDDQPSPTNLPMGTYTVTVSDDLNCSAVEIITIGEPEILTLNIEEVIEATCGNANGSVAIGITGGTTPYTYTWSNGASSQDIQDLTPGTYVLDFMDARGCTLSESFEVSEPNALTVLEGPISQVDCFGGNNGSIQVTAQGGSGPGTYSFMWSNGDTDELNDNLIAGPYTLTVIDADGCSFEYSTTISEPDPIMIIGTATEATCGVANGTINLTVTGGTGDYTYLWDNGADPVSNPGNLTAGLYNVTITDQNNCQALPFNISVTSPNAPEIGVTSTPITCNGANDGTIDLNVTGGTAPVDIIWNDPNFNGQTSVNDLLPGIYEITAVDAVGCTFPVMVTITEPPLLEAFVIDPQSSTLCNGSADGSIELTVQGGTGDYAYQWTNGAPPVPNPDNLPAGIYEVIVTDGSGCTVTESVLITEPDAISLTADPLAATCSNTTDGGIEVSVVGGTGGYDYLWSDGQTVEDISDLEPGNYTLVVSDQNSCNGTIDVVVPAPAPVAISLTDISDFNGLNTSCNESEDGFITVSATGGNAGYSYAWADGTNGPTIADIGQGNYSIIVTDQEGCTGENSFPISGPAPITLEVETDAPECFGDRNGVIIINEVQGGRLPYRYSLNNGDFTSAQFFGNLGSGTFSLAVEDANGCTNDVDVIVDSVEELTIDLDSFDVREITLGDMLTLEPMSNDLSIPDSAYVWAIGFDGDTLEGLRPVVSPLFTTSYSITVTDEFGCTASDDLLVQVNKPRSIYIPNAFNPNSTNGNNQFTIHGGQDVAIVRSVRIFNRWGEVIFSDRDFPTDDPTRGSWDGNFRNREAQSGVYVYIVEVDFIDGESKMYSGDITLLR